MDAATALQVLQAAKLVSVKLSDLAANLDLAVSKIDQLVSREMRSAYEALHDYLLSSHPGTMQARLDHAERAFQLNVGLNPMHDTDGISNSELIAHAHFGLAYIARIRGDEQIAARHLVKMFQAEPRLARTQLSPTVYDRVFLPRCEDIIKDSISDLENVHEVGTERESPNGLQENVNWIWNKALGHEPDIVTEADHASEVDEVVLKREASIDARCIEVASELLIS